MERKHVEFIYGVARINESSPFITFTTFKDADEFAKMNKNIDNLVVVKLEEDKWIICVDEYNENIDESIYIKTAG